MSNVPDGQASGELLEGLIEIVEQAPSMLEMFPCAVYLIKDDQNLTVIRGNAAFYKLFGCTEEEMRHRYANRLSALISTKSLRDLDIMGRRNTGEPAELKQQIKRGGTDAWINTKAVPFSYKGQDAFCCVSFDVTREETELRACRRIEEESRLIAEQGSSDLFEYDLISGRARLYNARNFFAPEQLGEFSDAEDFPSAVVSQGMVDPEYMGTFCDAFNAVKAGSPKAVCELRMKVKNGRSVWARLALAVNQKGPRAGKYAVGILENINQQKNVLLRYLNETQFYQAMLSEKTAFAQADITEDKFTRFGGIWNLYNEIINTRRYSELIDEFINKVVHPEDRKHYLELMQRENFIESLDNGVDQLGCEFRRIVEQNKMVWMELKVHLFRDPFTHHILALLYIKDIDAKKKQELALVHDSERDHLTNIYNKKMAENLIRGYLKRMDMNEVCAFMILDLDNFKYINDAYGHKAGDQVLVRLAEMLAGAFRRDDIIGRFGGDEFIIFLKRIASEENALSRIENLYEDLCMEREPEFSCSIGLSMVRQGDSYEKIFRQADVALYAAKNGGKGKHIVYSEESMKECSAAARNEREEHPLENHIQKKTFEEESTFEAFLGEQGEIAYLVDPDNFNLICGNQAFYDRIGRTETECIGIKCYEAMHKRDTPCPFCSKANWATDKFYMWKNLNTALEQEFLIKNKLVQWNGREVVLAIAIDISNNKSIVDSMENGATESHSILSGVQRMAEADNLSGALKSALETIGYFFRADAVRFWERETASGAYRCGNAWTKAHQSGFTGEAEVNAWLQGRKWDQPILIESPETMLCYSYDMYQYMINNNIVNQRWMQLRDGDQELGCLVLENISSNFQNVAFLESFTVFMAGEIRKRRLMESVLYSNEHDDLTDLLSRNSYERYLQEYRGDQVPAIGVVVANFDNLKGVNSAKGFPTGNYYLKQFAGMMKEVFQGEAVFRLNGDEFLAIDTDIDRPGLEAKIQKLKALLETNDSFTVSVGYSWDNVENDLAVLIEQATEAMKVDKKRRYDSNPVSVDVGRRKMLSELMTALENHEFEVYLQPKVELAYSKVIGAEALIRYRHKKLGIITPDKFISTLEKNNLIRYIDLFVFEETCRVLDKWKQAGLMLPIISLNFSRLTLLERDILSSMEKIIAGYDVSRKYIEIEITESVANMGKSILYQAARELYDAGFNISLDDFGTKYTNLSILADIDFSMLKLDKSLIGTLVDQSNNQVILKNIIYMCRDLGIDVIAEGVETQDQEKVLRELKCKLGQGYLYGKPMPIREFDEKYISLKQTV